MTTTSHLDGATPWLPPGALDRQAIERDLLETLDAWAGHWLVDPALDLAAIYQDLGQGQGSAWRCRAIGGVVLAWRDGMEEALAGQLLSQRIVPDSLLATDRRLIDRLVRAAVDDLLNALGTLFVPGAPQTIDDAIVTDATTLSWWEVSQASRAVVHVGITERLANEVFRRSLPPAQKLRLQSRRQGLAAQSLTLGATIGRCAISLADLKGLTAGDTLVLDRPTADPVALLVDTCPSPLRADLDSVDERATLILSGNKAS